MFQHRLHDAVGTFAVLGDLFQVAGQHGGNVVDLCALLFGQRGEARRGGFLQLAQQIHRQSSEVVDEVERVLDFVRNAAVSWPSEAIFSAWIRLACAVRNSRRAVSAASRAARISSSLRFRSVMSL